MYKKFSHIFLFLFVLAGHAVCQELDTMVDVGGYRVHFHVVKGAGLPILFDAGGGNDGTIWKDLLVPLHEITGATLITYDRPGFGKSEVDKNNTDPARHGIINGIEALETGLRKLGYAENIFLVGHSYGGFYSELYAARHPLLVSGAVLIDANHVCWFTDAYTNKLMESLKSEMEKNKSSDLAKYYQFINLPNTMSVMRSQSFPASIPVTDLVAEHPPFGNDEDDGRWRDCHRQFVEASPKRKAITAKGCGHYIFIDNPPLVIHSIVELYASLQTASRGNEIMQRGLAFAVAAANQAKGDEMKFSRSEDNLNSWGYDLLKQHDIAKAIEVFKLNTILHPQSPNAFDSLGEAYEDAGNKEEAIKNYKRCLELEPKSSNAAEHLKKLQAQ